MPDAPYDDPLTWFDAWFSHASQTVSPDPNAMTLATVSAKGRPSIRVVLLKHWDERGFVFHTNRRSRKGRQIGETPHAALNFYWRELTRQIRIEGDVEKLSEEESDAYFASRPRGSQIGAWASLQSEELDSPDELRARIVQFEQKFPDEIPRPPHWGGYRLRPLLIEFWEAGEFRLHDRWEWRRASVDSAWTIRRLFP